MKDAQNHQSSGKCKLKPQFRNYNTLIKKAKKATTPKPHTPTTLKMPSAGRDVENLVSYVARGIHNDTGSLKKTVQQFLIKLNIHSPYDSTIPLLGIDPSEGKAYAHTNTCMRMFTGAFVIITKAERHSGIPRLWRGSPVMDPLNGLCIKGVPVTPRTMSQGCHDVPMM